MQYNPAERIFEVSIRMFTDDLEVALSRETTQKIRLAPNDAHDPLVERYIRKHFAMQNARKQPRPYQYVGKEPEGDATWVYIEIPFGEALAGSVIRQDVLMEVFDDQVNLINVTYQSQRKTLLFRKNESVQEINES